MIKTLLALRNKLKAKKPTFLRHDVHKKKRVSESYRKPKGRQNKMRLNRRGYARSRSTGFSAPVAVRGLSREGLTQNSVATLADFQGLDVKKDGIIVARTVGNKRRAQLLEHANKAGFTVLNLDAKSFEATLAEKKKAKEQHQKLMKDRKKKHDSSKKATKKADAKESKEPKESKESKKSIDTQALAQDTAVAKKKEQDKILTKKGEQQ